MALRANLRCILRLPRLTVDRCAEGYPKEGATAVGFTGADDVRVGVLKRPTCLFRAAVSSTCLAAQNAPSCAVTLPVTCVLQALEETKGEKKLSKRAAFLTTGAWNAATPTPYHCSAASAVAQDLGSARPICHPAVTGFLSAVLVSQFEEIFEVALLSKPQVRLQLRSVSLSVRCYD